MKYSQKIRKLIAALLIVVLMTASVPVAFAASFAAYVSAGSMTVYSDASLEEKIGSLEKYTVVKVKDHKDGVAKISFNGKNGYARTSDMKSVDSVAKAAYLTEDAKAYKSASTSSASMKVTAGTKVNVIATNGGWSLVEKAGVGAYIQTKYLSDKPYTNPIATAAPTQAPTAAPTEEPETNPIATAVPTAEPEAIAKAVVNANARIYKLADTESASVSVKKGTKVEVIEIRGDWAYIRNANGVYAFIQKKYLSEEMTTPILTASPAPTAEPTAAPAEKPTEVPVKPTERPQAIVRAIVNADAKIYKKADTGSASASIAKGTKVEVIEVRGDWAYIRNANDVYAYINKKYLSDPDAATAAPTAAPTEEPTQEPTAEPTEEPTAAPTEEPQAIARAVVNAKTKVYRKASTASASLTVKKGTKVEVISISGDWAYIRNAGGTYAYILRKYLTSAEAAPTPTVEPSAAPTAEPTAEPTIAPTEEPEAIAAAVVNAKTKAYKKPDTGSASVTVKAGTKVEIISVNGDWAYVRSSGGTYAFIERKYLTDPNATPTPSPAPDLSQAIPATVTASSVKVYRKPDSSGTSMATLKKGAQVNVIEFSDKWAYIEMDGNYGYCKLSALTKNSDLVDAEYTELVKGAEAVVISNADVYEKANTGSPKVGALKKGKTVAVTAYTNDGKLARIKLGSTVGWCSMSALEIVKKDPLEGYTKETFDATVVTTDAKIYENAGEGEGAAIAFGTDVTVGAYNSKWAYVKHGGKTGFVPVSALSRASFAKLSKGSSGSEVSTLEKALLASGYFDAIPNDTYDAATASAVQRFQSACGLTQTGEASQSLQRMLYSGNGPVSDLLSMTLKSGMSGENVTRVQNRLYALGYLSKTGSIDGSYGTTTANAITLFQGSNGISVSGGCNPATLRKLYSTSASKLPSGKTPADVVISPTVSEGSQTSNGTSISSSLASTTDYYSSSMSAAQKLEYAIYCGQNQLGKPYVYGTSGTASFDCSGFSLYCYKQIGVTLKRTAQLQGYDDTYTKIESISGLKRGDLVFFNTVSSDSDLCDHSGIYLGSGWFIHASSGQAKVVVSNLSSGYYNRVFSWGRRVMG